MNGRCFNTIIMGVMQSIMTLCDHPRWIPHFMKLNMSWMHLNGIPSKDSGGMCIWSYGIRDCSWGKENCWFRLDFMSWGIILSNRMDLLQNLRFRWVLSFRSWYFFVWIVYLTRCALFALDDSNISNAPWQVCYWILYTFHQQRGSWWWHWASYYITYPA